MAVHTAFTRSSLKAALYVMRCWYLPCCLAALLTAGVKQGLGLLSRYLYVLTDDTSPDGAACSQLQVLDVKNKLVAGGASRAVVPMGSFSYG
jgi:hypothetical protein